jgi:phage terminase large subunit GpA-like protein
MNVHAFRRDREGPVPAFARAVDALAATVKSVAPVERISVADAAERHRRISSGGARSPWRNDVAPYMVEPMNMSDSRRFRGLVFVGPARSVKSEALVNNVIAHRVKCRPRVGRLICPDMTAAREYSLSKLDTMIWDSPDIAERLMPGRYSNTTFEKRFIGGMRLTVGWPVKSHLAMVDLFDILFTDYDRMPMDVDGEGSPWALGFKRIQTFGTQGMAIAESSPGKPILDEAWRAPADAPHMAPPCDGILSLYNDGTRARRYWQCDHCGDLYEPDFKLFDYPKTGDPMERGRKAVLLCPHCGGVHEPARRRDLDAAGVWLHEGTPEALADGSTKARLVAVDDDTRDTEIVSYWLKGPCAAFQPWAQLVSQYLTALDTFATTGSEEKLKTTVNVDQALPYKPQTTESETELSPDQLRGKPAPIAAKIVPAAARFVVLSVDAQSNRFVVQADAFGVGLERWMIDRFDIHQPPQSAPGAATRAIAPPLYAEDWKALDDLLATSYAIEGSASRLLPMALIVDSGGAPGTTQNAYAWWRAARKTFGRRRVFLVKGLGGVDRQPRAIEREPEKIDQTRQTKSNPRRRKTVHVVFAASDVLKDEVAVALARKMPGPGAYHLASGLPAEVYTELCAERRSDDGWEMKAGQRRNEAFDCAYYGKALAIVLGAESIDWNAPPAWAAPFEANAWVQRAANDDPPAEPASVALPVAIVHEQPVVPVPVAPPVRGRRMRSRGWGG